MHWFPWQININKTNSFIHHPLIHQYHSFYKNNNNNTTTTTTYNNIYKIE